MMAIATAQSHVLIGTAGHIDHGKTRLIGRLTGIATDRLPEEKRRGISIDLGFALWEDGGLQFGVVDVPGHERFVRNMVAGATGINVALLVVAADDGVMPQTREHLEIMDLLGIPAGVVAITKIDLAERDFVELVRAEVEELVEGTFLENCAIVPVSSETGEGIEELKAALHVSAARLEASGSSEFFRMPVDRVFTLEGHGTIVTGSVLSGTVKPGETLELLPERLPVRIRSVQSHGHQAEWTGSHQRTALNVAGVKSEDLRRGQELASPDALIPTRRVVVQLRCLASSPMALKDRMELSLHIGTSETPARLATKGIRLNPGEQIYAELRTRHPIVAAYGQCFILRRISPALTVAGGTVLDPHVEPGRRLRDLQAYAAALDDSSDRQRLSFVLSQLDRVPETASEAVWRAGISAEQYATLGDELKSSGELVTLGGAGHSRLIHSERLRAVGRSVMRTIRVELARRQPCRLLPKNTVLTACRKIAAADLIDEVLTSLVESGELVATGDSLGPADAQVQLTKNQRQARDAMLEAIAEGGLLPPSKKEHAESIGISIDQIEVLLELGEQDGLLVRVSDDLFFTPEAIERAADVGRSLLAGSEGATMSQLREAWGVSRKYAVPLSEYFDRRGLTVRRGDVRVLGDADGR